MRSNDLVKKMGIIALAGLLSAGSIVACGSSEEEVPSGLFGGLGKDELFRVGDVSCSMSEYMVYLTNTQNQYENVYGSEIWNVALDEVTLEENVKDTVLAKIA